MMMPPAGGHQRKRVSRYCGESSAGAAAAAAANSLKACPVPFLLESQQAFLLESQQAVSLLFRNGPLPLALELKGLFETSAACSRLDKAFFATLVLSGVLTRTLSIVYKILIY
eukprot:1162102-Pelagomonas_calceolata.AAC.1